VAGNVPLSIPFTRDRRLNFGWRDLVRIVALAVVALEVGFVLNQPGSGGDAHAYWAAQFPDPYAGSAVDQRDAYLYSPAFLHALTPLRWLPAELFHIVWTIGLAAIVVWLAGPVIAAIVLVPTPFSPVFTEIWFGNISLLLAVVAARGLHFPAFWALAILTKVTPGVCLLWFAVRREWSKLAMALAVTAGIALVSFALAPDAWFSWVRLLAASSDVASEAHVPNLAIRIAVAAALIVIGALRSEPRVLPPAIIIALPVFWYASFSILLVWVYQLRQRARETA
jgi:hypothetical protein